MTLEEINIKRAKLETSITTLISKFVGEIKPIKGLNIECTPVVHKSGNKETYLYTDIKTEITI